MNSKHCSFISEQSGNNTMKEFKKLSNTIEFALQPKRKPKYGKVYIQKQVIVAEDDILEELPGILFSNQDFRFYTLSGEPHPNFENYEGKPFCLQFQLQKLHNLKSHQSDFTGKFSMPLGLGLVRKPDFENINEANFRDLQFCKKLQIFSETTGRSFMRKVCGAELAASINPGANLLELKLTRVITIFVTLLDDSWDDDKPDGKLSWSLLKEFNKTVGEILDGIIIPKEEIQSQFPPFLAKHLLLLEWIYENIITDWKEFSQPVIRSIKSYLQINSLQGCREWKEMGMASENEIPNLLTRVELKERWLNMGGVLMLETALFDQRVHVPENIRACQFFKYFLQLTGKQTALVNDILSCRKDFQQSTTCSAVVICVRKEGQELLDALEAVLNKANRLTDDVVTAGKVLMNLYPDNQVVAEAVRVALSAVCCQYMWYANGPRYENTFVLNCVV